MPQPDPDQRESTDPDRCPYVGRGGLKLEHALRAFNIDPRGRICADLGCNVGGFTDCLLQHAARLVYAIDTGYGALAWKLRNDPRVRVMERTNALHAEPPADPEDRPDLIAIDLAWTPQRLCLPAAVRWLRPTPTARIISLIKPHYETRPDEQHLLQRGVLPPDAAERIARRTFESAPEVGVIPLAITPSPILGGRAKKTGDGNAEYLGCFALPAASA